MDMSDKEFEKEFAEGCGALIGRLGCLLVTVVLITVVVVLVARAMGVVI